MLGEYHKPYWIDKVELPRAGVSFRETPALARGLASNPNAAGVLVVGLVGDETLTRSILEGIKKGECDHARSMILRADDPETGETFGSLLDRLAANTARTRFGFGASDLRVGVADDGCEESRLFAREFSDWLVSNGFRSLRPDASGGAAFESLVCLGAQMIALVRSRERYPEVRGMAPVVDISVRPAGEPPSLCSAVGMECLFDAVLAAAAGEVL
jgi:hypothetical protein